MDMKTENNARNNYGAYAVGASRAERSAKWDMAAALWQKALDSARTSGCRKWAESRIAFCTNAAARKWSGTHESQSV
jgi:hypothetical protein